MAESKQILIVEDSEENILFMSQILEDHGYSYVVAHNGNEALAAMEEQRPALVLLDIMMPRKSGVIVLKRMKNSPELQDVPVIVVTGTSLVTGVDMHTGEEEQKETYADDFKRGFGQDLREKIFGLKPDGFIEKPIDPPALVAKIEELLA
jgi:CheY-like chemotaxis protein